MHAEEEERYGPRSYRMRREKVENKNMRRVASDETIHRRLVVREKRKETGKSANHRAEKNSEELLQVIMGMLDENETKNADVLRAQAKKRARRKLKERKEKRNSEREEMKKNEKESASNESSPSKTLVEIQEKEENVKENKYGNIGLKMSSTSIAIRVASPEKDTRKKDGKIDKHIEYIEDEIIFTDSPPQNDVTSFFFIHLLIFLVEISTWIVSGFYRIRSECFFFSIFFESVKEKRNSLFVSIFLFIHCSPSLRALLVRLVQKRNQNEKVKIREYANCYLQGITIDLFISF